MPDLKLDTHTEAIKDLIKNYKKTSVSSEIGQVVTNSDGILTISGLNDVQLNEVVIINDKFYALVLSLNADLIGAVMLSEYDEVKEGNLVKRSGRSFSAPVGSQLLGRAISVVGRQIDGGLDLGDLPMEQVERIAPGVMERQTVSEPLYTGILAIDSLIPIGKGQRELIIGDRQTGKTSIAIDAIINQKGKDCYCVYVSIGQKNSTLFQLIQKLKDKDALSYTTIVNASASDLPSLKYLAPFVGITIAEKWMREGKDVLIVYDDLTQHAIAYRTMSLLLNFAPGREAFPGDVFYLHSRLLERAGRLSKEYGGGSITALPIIQTQADDISAYIPTNVISITDGQIFLKTMLFNQGQRPAIDVGLSVSRVGGSAQKKAIKDMSSTMKLELAQYFEVLEFSRFGSELNDHTKNTLDLGAKIQKCLIQKLNKPRSPAEELFILCLIRERYILKVEDVNDVVEYLDVALNNFAKSDLPNSINFDVSTPLEHREKMRDIAYSSYEEFLLVKQQRQEEK
ncbi:F0F1 ATP synthase subunit alpha [Candidatus Mycoplasma haematohominis]|uniref:ATP synthase subunit alpha n=1 Tax=Candidatus Mycoplasma haematohominis TaxID=1494318 RepID=A0A478FUV3_9MOLU|nr:F0F1 ATP synthase subunit alpha [Candidatus Mycoplasma haemohominis]GCE63830.1 ATP synthase subunit alpha [Candidatus Mycoplasma haemohominis]